MSRQTSRSTKIWIVIMRVAQTAFVLSLSIPIYKTIMIFIEMRTTKAINAADEFPIIALGSMLIVVGIMMFGSAIKGLKQHVNKHKSAVLSFGKDHT